MKLRVSRVLVASAAVTGLLLTGAAISPSWAVPDYPTAGEVAEAKNNVTAKKEMIARLEKIIADQQVEADKLAKEKFLGGQGGKELEMRKALLDYDMKAVRAAKDKISYAAEYHRVKTATGSHELADEAAGDKVKLEMRDRAGSYAGLVNARDGAGDTRNVAEAAMGQMRGDMANLEKLRGDMNANHGQSMNPPANFFRP